MTGDRVKSTGGRPPVGPNIHLKLPPDLLQKVDDAAHRWNVTRSEAIRRLLELALP